MPVRRAKKAYPKAIPNASLDDEVAYSSLPSLPPPPPPPPPPLDCLPSLDSPNESTIDISTQQARGPWIKWTAEMIEALVECIYRVWKDGRAANNRFKKEV
jgi:hypothetical protein